MKGRLRDMTVADLIQHSCQARESTHLVIRSHGEEANIYFEDGEIAHATLNGDQGEEVVYQILSWEDGEFSLERGVKAPVASIDRAWTSLLLEGAKRIDEEKLTDEMEAKDMAAAKKKGEILNETLASLLEQSTDLEGAAVVGTDGLVYSIIANGKVDDEMVGAVAAAVLGSSKRSSTQLNRGEFNLTLIQGDKGNIIVKPLNEETLIVALTPDDVNLGMAFAETRSAGDALVEVL